MAGGPLEPVSYIGERLRSWRDEKNLSGPEVCVEASRMLDGELKWKRLHAYERGNVLPDLAEAVALTEVLDHSIIELLIPAAVANTTRQPVTIHALPDLRVVLRNNGTDEGYAEEFARLGVNAGLLRRWLKSVPAEQALQYLAAGIDRVAASGWHASGIEPELAIVLASAGLEPGAAEASSFDSGEDTGRLLVRALRVRLGLPAMNRPSQTPQFLDPLESIPWELWDFPVPEAQQWVKAGLMPVRARFVSGTFTPAEATPWAGTDVPVKEWEAWHAAGWPARDADRLSRTGLTAASATPWRGTGLDVDAIVMLRSAGLTPEAVADWQTTDASLTEICDWHRHRLTPNHHRRWSPMDIEPEEVLTWLYARTSVETAKPWILAGVRTAEMRHAWTDHGFRPTEAADWGFIGPERARELIGRGVALDRARERHANGAATLLQARTELTGRARGRASGEAGHATDRRSVPATGGPANRGAATGRTETWFRSTAVQVPVCNACGQPIRDGTRCGC